MRQRENRKATWVGVNSKIINMGVKRKIEEPSKTKDFFQKMSKMTLPALALIGMSMSTMTPSSAAVVNSKKGKADIISTKGNHAKNISSTNLSSSCDEGCSGGCSGGCEGSCSGGCSGGCNSTCSGGCEGCSSCSGGCTMT